MTRADLRKGINSVFIASCTLATLVALVFLGMILFSLFEQGFGGLNLDVFTLSQPPVGERGGLLNAIVGSIMMCSMAMAVAITIGILAGTWLAEYGGDSPYSHVVRFLNDVLLAAPSILIGLFIYEGVVAKTHHFSGYAGALALALLAVPVVTRTTEDILRLQPDALREAGAGLGTPKWVVVRDIIWRGGLGGLITGALLAFARISGETAPLLFTALGNNNLTFNLDKPMGSLPGVIFNFALSAYDDWRRLAWAGALLIALTVLSINILGRVVAARGTHRS